MSKIHPPKEGTVKNIARREAAYTIIDSERDYQDEKWGTVDKHGHEVGSWILIMESLLADARKAFQSVNGDLKALGELRKVVATGIACIEQHGCPTRDAEEFEKGKERLSRKSGLETALGL